MVNLKSLRHLAKRTYRATVGRFAPSYEQELERALGNCKTLLDVGCGAYSPIKEFSKRLDATGVDGYAPSIARSRLSGIHQHYAQMDLLRIGQHFSPRQFECVLASDVIEHFERDQGEKLLADMERLASKRVIVFTPNGFVPQGEYDENPLQIHRSGWTVADFARRGYRVIGIGGHKLLKGEYGAMRYKPAKLWYLIADLTQRFVHNRPARAYQLLAVKDIR